VNIYIFATLLMLAGMQQNKKARAVGVALACSHGLHELIFSPLSVAYYHIYYIGAIVFDAILATLIIKRIKTASFIVCFLAISCTISLCLNVFGYIDWEFKLTDTLYSELYMWLYLSIVIVLSAGALNGLGRGGNNCISRSASAKSGLYAANMVGNCRAGK
jgi:hypothetical protein